MFALPSFQPFLNHRLEVPSFKSVRLIDFKSTVNRTDVTLSDGDVVEAAAIGSPRIRAVVSEAGGQGEIWIDGRFICSNRVGSISGEVWRISGLITCVTLHQDRKSVV